MRPIPPSRGARHDHVVRLPSSQDVIATPGYYLLHEDRTAPVGIRAGNVVLDLGGKRVAGSGDPATRGSGVYIEHGLADIKVTNGSISGFMYGVLADDGADLRRSARICLERLSLVGNTFRGALLFATDSSVEQCRVGGTGGTTVHDDAYVMGIELRGDRSRACRNTVYEFYGREPGESAGICLSDEGMDECLVEGNTVVNARVPAEGRSFGVWARNRATIRGNTLVNLTYAMAPPDYRSPENTIDNIVIGEQCTEGFFSAARKGLRTVFVSMQQAECPDCLDRALERMNPNDASSIVRVASLLEAGGDDDRALAYYHQAAALGSAEAMRWVGKLTARKDRPAPPEA